MSKTSLLILFAWCMNFLTTHATTTPQGPFIDPQGEKKEYTRAGEGFYTAFSGAILIKNLDRLAATVIENEEGEIYFSHPFVSLRTDCYLKGEWEGDRIKMTFPQVAYVSSPDKMQSLYVMEYTGLDGEKPTYKVSDIQTLYMNVNEEGVISLELPDYSLDQEYPLQILGLCGEDKEWDGFGEYQMSYIPFKDKRITPPVGLETEEWSFIYKENGYNESGSFVKVGFSNDNKIYVQGISQIFPEAWIEGRVEGNNVIFESAQYVGSDNIQFYHCYFFGGKIEMVYNPDWEEYYPDGVIAQSLTLKLDGERKEMRGADDECIIINTNKETTMSIEQFWYVSFNHQSSDISLTPQEPNNLYYSPDFGMDYCSLSFNIPIFNINNELLHTSNLYYSIYIDGELMTFYPDEYQDLDKEITILPFDFNCGYDIQSYGAYHNVNFFAQDITTIGVQSVYIDEKGNQYKSAIITYDVESGEITSGISHVVANDKAATIKYYDLNGREITRPDKGVYIQRAINPDGTFTTKKIFINTINR